MSCELSKDMKDISLESCANGDFNTFNSCFTRVLNQFAPLISASNAAKSNSPIWLNNRLKNLRSKKNQVHRHWKKTRDQTSFNKFHKLRSTFEAELKKSKKHFYTEKFKYCIGDSRQVYKLLNDIKGSNNSTKVAALNKCTDSSEIAHKFNEYFTGIANELRKSLPNAPCSTELETVQHSMFLRKVSMAEVLEILISFENKSSSGDDNVNMIIVKKSASVIAPYLELLINCSFAQGVFPSDLKQAKVIPLHKGGSRLDEKNYRPISLIKVWSKIFERAMFVRLYQYFENFNLLYEKQYGFRKKHSTIDALVNFSEKVRLNEFRGRVTSFFLDLKKAFDTIDHGILLNKLSDYGIRGHVHAWFESYLSNRSQKVIVNDKSSEWLPLKFGVPQGSSLGPLLFIIYVNDLPKMCSNVDILLFADDTNITAIGCSDAEISMDLIKIEKWLIANKLVLNSSKTYQLDFRSASKQSFMLNNTAISVVPMCKYLGVCLDSKFSFQSHSDIRSYNASIIINYYHKLKNSFLVDNPALVQIIFAT